MYYSERNLRFFHSLFNIPTINGLELYALSSARRVLFAFLKVFLFYEALIFLSWSLTLIHLIVENFINDFLIGVITAPTALFLNAFASFRLPESLQKLSPLIPALKSNWLIMHVTVMLFSYATLICGCLLSITFLFLFDNKIENLFNHSDVILKKTVFKKNFQSIVQQDMNFEKQQIRRFFQPPCIEQPWNFVEGSSLFNWNSINANNIRLQNINRQVKIHFFENKRKKLLQKLDQLSFRAIGIGFPFLTIGILSGSVWANEAWGSYWNWDPKETWSLITWIIFAIYLHLRFTKNWNGFQSAILATIGFLSVWICFLGVNFLAKGLHSYGWFH